MRRTEATAWVVSVCAVSLRLSQAKTLANLVAAAMGVQRVSLANIGRRMLGSAKHQIKRCWRFCANDRVETADAMFGIIAGLLNKRRKPLVVALDWVDIRGFQTLVASAVLKGRSTPICWASTSGHSVAVVRIVRPADDHRATLPRPQIQTQRLELEGHAIDHVGSSGPIAADLGHRLSPLVRHQPDRTINAPFLRMVLWQQRPKQPVPNRPADAGKNGCQSAPSAGRCLSLVRNGGWKVGIGQVSQDIDGIEPLQYAADIVSACHSAKAHNPFIRGILWERNQHQLGIRLC